MVFTRPRRAPWSYPPTVAGTMCCAKIRTSAGRSRVPYGTDPYVPDHANDIGGADPDTPLGTDPDVPYGTWAQN